jgi:hypothetical protein
VHLPPFDATTRAAFLSQAVTYGVLGRYYSFVLENETHPTGFERLYSHSSLFCFLLYFSVQTFSPSYILES